MNREVIGSLAWGGGIVIVALLATFARKQGYVDAETVTRLVIGLNGLMIAWFGNRLPKTLVSNGALRKARLVSGTSLLLSGLAYAGLWAFAPIRVAIIGGCAAVALGIVVTLGYCLLHHRGGQAA